MKIDDIRIERSAASPGEFILRIESKGHIFTGYFDNLITFMHAVGESIKYFGQVHGLITVKDGVAKPAGRKLS